MISQPPYARRTTWLALTLTRGARWRPASLDVRANQNQCSLALRTWALLSAADWVTTWTCGVAKSGEISSWAQTAAMAARVSRGPRLIPLR